MIDSMSTADVANADRFARIGVAATPQTAAHTRDEFAAWLRRFYAIDETRVSDAVLAVNEALANSAEFAYVNVAAAGTMDVQAWHDPATATITVEVLDRGTWRVTDGPPNKRTRGRGIPLMHALCDEASIETSADGTSVRMAWANVARR